MWYDVLWNFLADHWKFILWTVIILYILRCMKASQICRQWVSDQFEWCKGFFVEDKIPGTPSHKNLIGIAVIASFCLAFVKTLAFQKNIEIPDIPTGWQIVILSVLGIRAVQSAAETAANKKWSGNGNPTPPPDKK